MNTIEYTEGPSGNCPVEATGRINGFPFFFRSRYQHWSVTIAKAKDGDPMYLGDHVWFHEERYEGEKLSDLGGSAGWATVDECRAFIERAAGILADRIKEERGDMELLMDLVSRCKGAVCITVNDHRSNHETVEQHLDWLDEQESPQRIADDVRAGILASKSIVEIQFYPDTAISFFRVVHHDIGKAIRLADAILDSQKITP